MKMNRRISGGYVGLLVLLITCCIIAFLFWRSDLFSSGTIGPGGVTTPAISPIQQDMNAIKAAQNAKQQIENYGQKVKESEN